MKITEVKNFLVSAPRDLHIVKVETDEGIYGLGEAGCSTREYAQEGAVRHFREFLIGMDPTRARPYLKPHNASRRFIPSFQNTSRWELTSITASLLQRPHPSAR